MSIRAKFRIVSLCIVLILVAVVMVGYWVASVEVTKKVHNNLNLVADLQLERVTEALDRNFERLEQVSRRQTLQENLVRFVNDSVEDSRDKVNAILREARGSVDTFKEISIISEEGLVLGSSNSDNIDANYKNKLFYRERHQPGGVLEGGRGVSFEVDEEGELTVVLSEPFMVEDDEQIGYIVIESDGSKLAASVTHESETQSLTTMLVKTEENEAMTVLTPADVVRAVREAGGLRPEDDAPLPLSRASQTPTCLSMKP